RVKDALATNRKTDRTVSADLRKSAQSKRWGQRNIPKVAAPGKGGGGKDERRGPTPDARRPGGNSNGGRIPVGNTGGNGRGGNGNPGKGGNGKPGRAGRGSGGSGGTGGLPAPSAGPTTTVPTDLATATQSVDMELNPQLSELMRQIAAAKLRLEQETGSINTATKDATGNIAEIYKRLQEYHDANQLAGSNAFGATAAGIDAGYGNLVSGLQQSGNERSSAANAELERLGIAAPSVNTEAIGRDNAMLQGLAQINREATAGGFAQQRANYNAIEDLMQGGAQTQGANHQAVALRQAVDAILGANQDFTGLKTNLEGEYSDIAGQRGAKINDMLNTMKAAQFEQQMELGQQQFMNQLARDKFGLSQAELQNKAMQTQAELKLANRKLRLERTKANQDAADKAADRAQRAAADLAKLKLEQQKLAAQIANGGSGGGSGGSYRPTGIAGAMTVISKNPDPLQQRKMNTIMRAIQANDPNKSGYNSQNFNDYPDIVKDINRRLRRQGIDTIANRRLMADALSAYFGKYGGS
ncbi:MAG TPA: hypothetical protein VFK94_06310, partial [Patescibacteria group bacterium]|nr:hypothetical protein [Patescibacteria group bacterium]